MNDYNFDLSLKILHYPVARLEFEPEPPESL